MSHVYTVECSECHRPWTGEFESVTVTKAPCKDCMAKQDIPKKGHPDIHINPTHE